MKTIASKGWVVRENGWVNTVVFKCSWACYFYYKCEANLVHLKYTVKSDYKEIFSIT